MQYQLRYQSMFKKTLLIEIGKVLTELRKF